MMVTMATVRRLASGWTISFFHSGRVLPLTLSGGGSLSFSVLSFAAARRAEEWARLAAAKSTNDPSRQVLMTRMTDKLLAPGLPRFNIPERSRGGQRVIWRSGEEESE